MLSLLGNVTAVPVRTTLTRGTKVLLIWSMVAASWLAGGTVSSGSNTITVSSAAAPDGVVTLALTVTVAPSAACANSASSAGSTAGARCRLLRGRLRMRWAGLVRRFDDVALHGREQAQQLIRGALAHVLLLEDAAQGVDHSIEFRLGDMVSRVHLLHGVARVVAGSAAQIADLFRQQLLDPLEVGVLEAPSERRIRGHPIDQRAGDGRDSALASEAIVQSRGRAGRG